MEEILRSQLFMTSSRNSKSRDDEEASDEVDTNSSLTWLLRKTKKKRGFEESSRVLQTKKLFKHLDEDEMSVDYDSDDDYDDDDGDENFRVLEEDFESGVFDEDDENKRLRVGDMVWAKPLPYTWWPGWISKGNRSSVLVSFFGHKMCRRYKNSEIHSFEKNFGSMLVQCNFLDAIDSALAELVRRMVLGLICPCKGSLMEENINDEQHLVKNSIKTEKMEFQPKAILGFVLRVAVCPWFEEAETISVVRCGAQVIAFRHYVSIDTDWIYGETMRLSETGLTSDDDTEDAMIQEADFAEKEKEGKEEGLTQQVERNSRICKEDRVEPLQEILTHLCCLALDPFYSPKGLDSTYQRILNYRKFVYLEVLDFSPSNSNNDHEVDITEVQEISKLDIPHLNHVSTRKLTEKEVSTRSVNGPHVSLLLSNGQIQHCEKSGIEEKCKEVMVDCTPSFVGEVSDLDHMVKDSIALVKDIPDHENEAVTNKTQGVSGVEEILSHVISTATRTELGNNFGIADNTHGCHLSCHDQEVTCKNVFDGRSMDVRDDCSLDFTKGVSPSEPVSEDAIKTHSDDSVGVANGETSESLSNLGDNHIMSHPRNHICAGDIITDKEVILEMVSEDNSAEKRRPSQPASSGFLSDFQKVQPLHPLNPVSSGKTRFQPSESNSCSDHPTSLHMKFPQDFKLPSKDELMKRFCSFGPLDSSRTKVFFYTGAAQVVFLCKLDAEAAYHFAKIKKKFFGKANVRFWLDPHENLRRANKRIRYTNATVGSSALNLKSCLRKSNAQWKNEKVIPNRVKFSLGSQSFSLSASTPSDSSKL